MLHLKITRKVLSDGILFYFFIGLSRKTLSDVGMLCIRSEAAALLFLEAIRRMPTTLVKVQIEEAS